MGTTSSGLVDREVGLLLITGKRIVLSAREVWQGFICADCLIFWAVSFGLVTFLFPVATEVNIPWWIKASGFAIFFGMIPVSYFLQLILLSFILPRFPRIYVFEPGLLLLTVFLIELVDHKFSPILFGEQWERWLQTATFGRQVAGDFVFMFAVDVLFCYFALPRICMHPSYDHPYTVLRPERSGASGSAVAMPERFAADLVTRSENLLVDAAPEPADPPPEITPKNHIDIDGSATPASAILAVEAEEHYVGLDRRQGNLCAPFLRKPDHPARPNRGFLPPARGLAELLQHQGHSTRRERQVCC